MATTGKIEVGQRVWVAVEDGRRYRWLRACLSRFSMEPAAASSCLMGSRLPLLARRTATAGSGTSRRTTKHSRCGSHHRWKRPGDDTGTATRWANPSPPAAVTEIHDAFAWEFLSAPEHRPRAVDVFRGRKVSRAGHFRPVNSLTWCDNVLPSRRAPRFRLRFRRIAQRKSAGFNTAPEVEGSSPSSPNALVLNLRDERPYVQWDRGWTTTKTSPNGRATPTPHGSSGRRCWRGSRRGCRARRWRS